MTSRFSFLHVELPVVRFLLCLAFVVGLGVIGAAVTTRSEMDALKAIGGGAGLLAAVAALGLADLTDIARQNQGTMRRMDETLADVRTEVKRLRRAQEVSAADDGKARQSE